MSLRQLRLVANLLAFHRSNNGHLTHALLHPSSEVTREYEAVVAGAVDHDILSRKLREGVETTDGVFTAELTLSENLEEVNFDFPNLTLVMTLCPTLRR